MKKQLIYCLIATVLSIATFVGICQASSVGSVFDQLKKENGEYINDLVDNGATEEQIENFVDDLESELSGTTLTESNFDEEIYEKSVNISGNHLEVVNAIINAYGADVGPGYIPSGLKPLYYKAKEQLIEEQQTSSDNGGSGSGSEEDESDPEDTEDIEEDVFESEVIEEAPINEEIIPELQPTVDVAFEDINQHWAQKEILTMAASGIARGVSAEEFRPGDRVTRAQFAAMLLRLLGIEEKPTGAVGFQDVGENSWYRGVVGAVVQEGLISGYSENSFGPDETVTREQMAVVLARVLEKRNIQVTSDSDLSGILAAFNDNNNISTWAKQGVAKIVSAGLMSGRQANGFAPQGETTRAEAVVLLYRIQDIMTQ